YETRDIFWNPKVRVGNAYAPFYRVNSAFWDPSIYGRFLVVAILASLVLVLHGAARRVAFAATAVVVVAWIGLVLSFSQSSFVALVVGVGIVAWFAWGRRTLALLGVIAAAIGVHSLFYNAFFEDPMAWSVFGLAPLAAAALARERVSEPVPKASVQQPAVVAAPQAGRSRAEAR